MPIGDRLGSPPGVTIEEDNRATLVFKSFNLKEKSLIVVSTKLNHITKGAENLCLNIFLVEPAVSISNV